MAIIKNNNNFLKTQKSKSWGCGSSGRVFAYQAQGLESHQQSKEKTKSKTQKITTIDDDGENLELWYTVGVNLNGTVAMENMVVLQKIKNRLLNI
jgi:hypothetical protein